MKLHTAGRSDPQMLAPAKDGRLSKRPLMAGINRSGARWKFSAR
jgi:hypothetical protein